jgi:hypothetical protein
MYTIFYSWQSDLDKQTTRYFIQNGLKKAAEDISKEGKFQLDSVIDRDTFGLRAALRLLSQSQKK